MSLSASSTSDDFTLYWFNFFKGGLQLFCSSPGAIIFFSTAPLFGYDCIHNGPPYPSPVPKYQRSFPSSLMLNMLDWSFSLELRSPHAPLPMSYASLRGTSPHVGKHCSSQQSISPVCSVSLTEFSYSDSDALSIRNDQGTQSQRQLHQSSFFSWPLGTRH